jgi:hypothetical protein
LRKEERACVIWREKVCVVVCVCERERETDREIVCVVNRERQGSCPETKLPIRSIASGGLFSKQKNRQTNKTTEKV